MYSKPEVLNIRNWKQLIAWTACEVAFFPQPMPMWIFTPAAQTCESQIEFLPHRQCNFQFSSFVSKPVSSGWFLWCKKWNVWKWHLACGDTPYFGGMFLCLPASMLVHFCSVPRRPKSIPTDETFWQTMMRLLPSALIKPIKLTVPDGLAFGDFRSTILWPGGNMLLPRTGLPPSLPRQLGPVPFCHINRIHHASAMRRGKCSARFATTTARTGVLASEFQ